MNLTFNHPEFEQEVRERLNIFDRELTVADAMLVKELDFTNFDFKDEDIETLFLFPNLTTLAINIGQQNAFFWNHFPKLQDLYWCCWGFEIDFSVFSNMACLTSLMVVNATLIVDQSDTEKVYHKHHIPCRIEATLSARRERYGSGDVTLLTDSGSLYFRRITEVNCKTAGCIPADS